MLYKPMDKNKDHWMYHTYSPSMPKLSSQMNPLNPSLPGSTSYLSVPLLFMLTLPKQPTDLMTGALLWILCTTTNWMMTCPVSMQNLKDSMLKWTQSGLQRPFVKDAWSWLMPPSNWHTWNAWQRHLFSRGTSNLPLEGDGRNLHVVTLARAGGNVTGLR